MDIPKEALEAAAKLNTGRDLRWRPVAPSTIFRVGFRINAAPPTLRITPLTADTVIKHTYVTDPARGVEWNQVELTAGFAYLWWTDPNTYLHLSFPCGIGGDKDKKESDSTLRWLWICETRWQGLLDTQLPHATIKAVVQAASIKFALDAINLTARLLTQANNDPATLNSRVKRLWAMRNEPDRIRQELTGYTLPADTAGLVSVIGGVRALGKRMTTQN